MLKPRFLRNAILIVGAMSGFALTCGLNNLLNTADSAAPEPMGIFVSIFAGLLLFWLSICVVVILGGQTSK